MTRNALVRPVIAHVPKNPVRVAKREGAPTAQGVDERSFTHGFAAEPRGGHTCFFEEGLDTGQQLLVGHDHPADISQRTLTHQPQMFAISETDNLSAMCEIADMIGDSEDPLLFRQLMAIRPRGMTNNQWLNQAGVNRSFFSDLRKRGRARTDIVDKLVEAVGVSPSEFYAMQAPEPSADARREEQKVQKLPFLAPTEARDVPIVGTAMGADYEVTCDGEMIFSEVTELFLDEVHDYARRPQSLVGRKEVYVVNTVGESMSPRFNPGDPMYVDPKAQPRIGDDVVVYLRKEEDDQERVYSSLVKELSRSTSTFIELAQHNPKRTFSVNRKEVHAIHRVIPWRELTLF